MIQFPCIHLLEGHPSTSSNARIQDSHTIHVQCSPKGIDKTFDGSEEIQEMNFDVDEPTDLIIDCESESESSPEVEINTVNTFTKQQANVSRVNTQQDFSKATLSNSSLTLCEAKMATIKKAFDTPLVLAFFHLSLIFCRNKGLSGLYLSPPEIETKKEKLLQKCINNGQNFKVFCFRHLSEPQILDFHS